jgi:hypothetical protein
MILTSTHTARVKEMTGTSLSHPRSSFFEESKLLSMKPEDVGKPTSSV